MTASDNRKFSQKEAEQKDALQKAALLHYITKLQIRQQDCFYRYLAVLDKQEAAIGSGNTENVLAYTEMEKLLDTDIVSIQKVINPLEAAFFAPMHTDHNEIRSITDYEAMKTTLEHLKARVKEQTGHNRNLISACIDDIRVKIGTFRNNPYARNGYGFQAANTASFIDIRG